MFFLILKMQLSRFFSSRFVKVYNGVTKEKEIALNGRKPTMLRLIVSFDTIRGFPNHVVLDKVG